MDKLTKEKTIEISGRMMIKQERLKKGYTQQQVANLAGCHLNIYHRLESGERSISRVSLRIGLAIADVLDLDPYLLIIED